MSRIVASQHPNHCLIYYLHFFVGLKVRDDASFNFVFFRLHGELFFQSIKELAVPFLNYGGGLSKVWLHMLKKTSLYLFFVVFLNKGLKAP